VASRAGLSRAYVSALELGRSKRPGADAIRRLEDVLGPLGEAPSTPHDLPPGLKILAEERRLPRAELQILASLHVRGRRPISPERWRFIYDALVASEVMDAPAQEASPWASGPQPTDRSAPP
jgi:transcriptional regulator with XRE-family HTH domain